MQTGVPERIGPYRLIRRLGGGGMGVIYMAEKPGSQCFVALKTVRVAKSWMLGGLRREIGALARLRHPGIVGLLDHGVRNGVPWYAMELCEGDTLETYLQRLWPTARKPCDSETVRVEPLPLGEVSMEAAGRPPAQTAILPEPESEPRPRAAAGRLREVLTIARRLCCTLAFLHGEGFVHRDLKPANIFLDASDRPVLLDFGLLGRFADETMREEMQTTGSLVGTLTYMAPEQATGGDVDPRADLYSLGCILFQLLTGRAPFEGATVAELVWRHAEVAPKAPSEIVDEVPPRLDSLVLSLLAKRPTDRPGYADLVAQALLDSGAESEEVPPAKIYLYRPRMVGRAKELAMLEGRARQLPLGGGGLIALRGESGVGKTRLLSELAGAAMDYGIRVLSGGCRESGRREPLGALRGPLRVLADACLEKGVGFTNRILGNRSGVLADYEPALSGLPGQDGLQRPEVLPARAGRARIETYLVETFTALAEEGPVLLLLDDLQWADALTFGFLERLVRLIPPKLLVVAGYRSDELPENHRVNRLVNEAAALDLERLGNQDTGRMVMDMLALRKRPEGFERFLADGANGNPFFVAAYVAAAVDRGLLRRLRDGTWRVETGPEAEAEYERMPLPRSLTDLAEGLIRKLLDPERELLQMAAVLGKEMPVDLLIRTADAEREAAEQSLRGLLKRGVLEERGSQAVFAHEQLRRVALGRLPATRTASLHRRAAGAMEAMADRTFFLAEIARHWEGAGETEKARQTYESAANDAARRYAYDEALRLYQACLHLTEAPSAESVKLQNQLGQTHRNLGEPAEALAMHRRALEEARLVGSRRLEAASLQQIGIATQLCEGPLAAQSVYLAALAIMREVGDRNGEGRSLGSLALVSQAQGLFAEAQAYYEAALTIQRETGDRAMEATTLCNLGSLFYVTDRPGNARSLLEQSLSIHRELRCRRGQAASLGNLANLSLDEGRAEEARACYEEALAIDREIGDRRGEAIELGNLGEFFMDRGEMDAAGKLFDRALAICRLLGDRTAEGIALADCARHRRQTGSLCEAISLFEKGLAIHREVGDLRRKATSLSGLADTLLDLGEMERARAVYSESLSASRDVANRTCEEAALVGLASIELLSDALADAAGRLDQAEELVQDDQSRGTLSSCLHGHLQLASGKTGVESIKRVSERARHSAATHGEKQAIARLQRANQAFEAGESLVCGFCREDLTEGQIAWLRNHRPEALQAREQGSQPDGC